MLRWILSFLFVVQIYAMMAIMGVLFLPLLLFGAWGARTACKIWCRWTLMSARMMLGITPELRGTVPTGEVLIAAKHQSFLDIIILFNALPAAKFIMKRELLWTPVIGQYAYLLGCVPVARGKRGQAIAKMLADVKAGAAQPGQLVIYPQGTRIPPGVAAPYKIGAALLYTQTQQPCVPVAVNVGVFWPRRGILKHPGRAVVEILPPIGPGIEQNVFIGRLEEEVEAASDRLLKEAQHG